MRDNAAQIKALSTAASGFVGVSILTDDDTDIVLNNRDGFNRDPAGGHYTDMGDHCSR